MNIPSAHQQDSPTVDTYSIETCRPATATGRLRLYTVSVVASSPAVGLVLGEASVRIFLDNRFHMCPPGLNRVFTPSPTVIPGITGASRYIINQDGLRGGPLPQDDAWGVGCRVRTGRW